MLHRLTLKIGSTLDREIIINASLEALVGSLQYPQAWFAAWDSQQNRFHEIRMITATSTVKKLDEKVPIPEPVTDFLTKVVTMREPLNYLDGLPLWKHDHPVSETLGTHHLSPRGLGLPIVSQNQVLGVLVIAPKDALPLGSSDEKLLSTIGHQLAMALDAAVAYEEIEALNLGLENKVKDRTIELQHANSRLEQANARLKELDRMKSKFLSHCSHELRTPLTSIKGFTENLLQGMVGTLSDRQHLYLTRINANSDRLTRMIADLLDLSRIEAGTVRLDRRRLSLSKVLEDATQELIPLTQSKEQQLVLETDGDSLEVMGDPDRLHQIITNLVHNAHKFTPEQGTIRIQASHAPPDHLQLIISDTGPGIPLEAQHNLFEPFFQAHRKPEIGTQGLGLGLSIVKQLIDLHGGTIGVESEEGHGATFRILLPAASPANPTLVADKEHEKDLPAH